MREGVTVSDCGSPPHAPCSILSAALQSAFFRECSDFLFIIPVAQARQRWNIARGGSGWTEFGVNIPASHSGGPSSVLGPERGYPDIFILLNSLTK